MDFTFTEEHEQVRDMVRRFAASEITPIARKHDDDETFPPEMFRKWGELGLLGVRYPTEDGGSGMDKISDCIVREELSYASQAFASSWSAHTHLGIWPIWKAGTPEQKAKYLPAAFEGRRISAFGLSEPGGGSNIRALSTKAEKIEGGWRISGAKTYITNSPIADFMLLAARTSPELKPHAISLFIIDLPNPAVSIHKLEKEGIRASETGLIHFDGLEVPDDALLGHQTGTYPIIIDSLSENRVGVAANALGMARAARDASIAYAREREVAGKRLGQYQAIAHKIADMDAEIEAARWLVYHGAWLVDQNRLTTHMAAKVKLFASEVAVRASEQAIRIHGGAGIMRDYSVGRIHRDALVYVIGEGTSEVQRNLISRALEL
ncbi:Acyl-CoA dehydrogenase [Thalassovita litoralis]|jgi:alkylation response protein AidB-like acyl-CoA dehydrogenase|uniref:Acyl-CoA dehydrogenase n=1 Tax=Thalassovita litoralis TaxID=1010611 RepID=A0A521BNZ3_9RHOB|nr:acyl-CoA dehydrogenase family protein [Thalassovita litoralis]SMO48491.1 Acyl-CoA dehydrogenase [Thalassovita litoralis]